MSFFLTSFAHGMDYSITPNCWARSQTGAGGVSAAGGCVQSSVWYSCSTRCTCCMWYACSCMICMLPLLILASCDAPTPALRHSSNKCCRNNISRSIDKKKSGIASISLHISFISFNTPHAGREGGNKSLQCARNSKHQCSFSAGLEGSGTRLANGFSPGQRRHLGENLWARAAPPQRRAWDSNPKEPGPDGWHQSLPICATGDGWWWFLLLQLMPGRIMCWAWCSSCGTTSVPQKLPGSQHWLWVSPKSGAPQEWRRRAHVPPLLPVRQLEMEAPAVLKSFYSKLAE